MVENKLIIKHYSKAGWSESEIKGMKNAELKEQLVGAIMDEFEHCALSHIINICRVALETIDNYEHTRK